MAKWGEGDPRWIVEERPDATNVNNWHWTEKNADYWSKKKLEELFTTVLIKRPDGLGGDIIIESLDKCEGEARANNRKAKLIFFYEWELVLKWKADVDDDEADVTGTVTIPNLSEEHTDMKDVDLEVILTSSSSNPNGQKFKETMRKGEGARVIRERLQKYVDALKSEFSQGLILPKGNSQTSLPGLAKSPSNSQDKAGKNTPDALVNAAKSASSGMKNLDIGNKIDTGKVEIQETFKCTGQELFNALTQREMIQVFTNGPVKMGEAKKGEAFEMLGGNISGRFEEVTPFTKIVQSWRLKSWPAGHYSKVEFNIKQGTEDTELKIVQTGVPSKEIDATKEGWARYYIQAIKRSFGFGSGFS